MTDKKEVQSEKEYLFRQRVKHLSKDELVDVLVKKGKRRDIISGIFSLILIVLILSTFFAGIYIGVSETIASEAKKQINAMGEELCETKFNESYFARWKVGNKIQMECERSYFLIEMGE